MSSNSTEWPSAGETAASDAQQHLLAYLTDGASPDEIVRAIAREIDKSRELLREGERLAAAGSWEWELGRGVRISEGLFRIVGLPPNHAEISFDAWMSRIHHDDRARVIAELQHLSTVEGSHHSSHRVVRAGGEVRTLSAHFRTYIGSGRQPTRMVGVSLDVTEQNAATAALRASEERHRLMFERNPLPMWIYDVTTLKIVAVNDAALARYGWTREEFLKLTLHDLRPEEDRPRLGELVRNARQMDDAGLHPTKSTRVRHRLRSGRLIHVDVLGHGVSLDGRAARLVMAHDVSEQVDAERAVRKSEARFRAFVEQSSDALLELDLAGTILYASPAITRILGHVAEDIVGRQVLEFVHPDDHERTVLTLAGLGNEGQAVHRIEVLGRHADGGWRVIESVGGALHERPNEVTRLLISIRDMTERRRADAALRESEALFRSLSASSPLGVFRGDLDGNITYVNARAAQIWEWPEGRLLAKGWAARVHPEDAEGLRAWCEATRAGQEYEHEYRLLLDDGSVRWVHCRSACLRDADGEIIGSVGTVEDVSERRELEGQLRQAQKMEAVGQLAGGIAHDFNNLLTVIKAHTEFLLELLPEQDEARIDAHEIGQAASRAAALTRQLLAFSRKQLLRPRALDLNDVLQGLEPMLRRLIGEDVAVVVRAEAQPAIVRADPGQIEQVVMNLAVNARDAMPEGGTVTIRTEHALLTAPVAHEHGVVQAGDYVVLVAQDNGVGMPESVRERAFEPFFTTKGPGKGTGLGLSTVYGIVRQSGGHVTLSSEADAGTTFRVYLPAVVTAPAGEAPIPQRSSRGEGTILLVEDEMPVRALARRVLERQGYSVLEARDPHHAIEIADSHGDGIDLLLTDVVMPEINGRALAQTLLERRPRMRVMYMSGYTDDVIVHRSALSPRQVLLHKPFTTAELASAVAGALQ